MGRQNQTPVASATDVLQLEEESLNTNVAATPMPLGVGESKTTIRWITPIYGQRVVKVAATNTKGK